MGRGSGSTRRTAERYSRLSLGLLAAVMIAAALWLGYRRLIDPIGVSLRKLGSGTVAERIEAAGVFLHDGASRRDEIVPALIEALRDEDPGVRIATIDVLEALIPFPEWNPPNVPLPEIDPSIRRAVLLALIDVAVRDEDVAVRRAARLITLLPCSPAELPTFLARSRDRAEDPEVRSWMLDAAYGADRPPRESYEAVRDALGDPAPRVRVAGYSVLRLGRSEFPIAEAELIAAARRGLGDPDPAVRFEASWLIPDWQHREASIAPWRVLIPAIFSALDRATTSRERLWLLRVLSVPARDRARPRALAAIVEELRTTRENSTDLFWLADALQNLEVDAIPAIPELIAIRPRFQDQPAAKYRLSVDQEFGELIGWLSALSVTLHASGALAR